MRRSRELTRRGEKTHLCFQIPPLPERFDEGERDGSDYILWFPPPCEPPMFLTLTVGTALVLIATLLPLWKHPHWLVRGWDFPRFQIAFLAALLLLVEMLFLDVRALSSLALLAATGGCLAWQSSWILPYTPLWTKEVKDADSGPGEDLGILTANVLMSNRKVESLLRLVREHRPDVLVTLETDSWWEERLLALEAEMPYVVKCPLGNRYGMHLFSRLPLRDPEISFLVEDDVPSIHAFLEMRSGQAVRVHFLHPVPPGPTENPESTERDAELVMVARSAARAREPVIVAGDLNDVAWSATTRLFRKISRLLDPRAGRGMFNTFHAGYPFIRWPLDHLFLSRDFTLRSIQRLPDIGSDHFPLLTRVRLAPRRRQGGQGLDAEASDHERAEEISGAREKMA